MSLGWMLEILNKRENLKKAVENFYKIVKNQVREVIGNLHEKSADLRRKGG